MVQEVRQQKCEKGLGAEALSQVRKLERNLLGLRVKRRFFRHLLLFLAVELADGIRFHLPGLSGTVILFLPLPNSFS